MSLSKKTKKIIVNCLTASRIVGALFVPIIFSCASIPGLVAVLTMLLVTDFLDGKLARKWNVQTKGGALLDPLGDKLLAVSCLLSLASTHNLLLVSLFLELGITAINVNRALHEEDVQSSIVGKIKTWVLSVTIVLSAINVLSPELLNLFGNMIPNLPDLTVTEKLVNTVTATTISAQVITASDYIKESLKQWDTRSRKIAELKNLRETLVRLFDEKHFEEDKDRPLVKIMKK